MKADPNAVAVLGFHDGSAGQVESWFEATTGLRIACFVLESPEPPSVDIVAENKKRVSQRTEFPTRDSFKGRPFVVSPNWLDHLEEIGVRKVLPLTTENRVRLHQIEMCRARGMELVSAIHPTVLLLDGATVEPGVWINAGSLIGYKAEIETGVIINTRVQIDHHNVLQRCSQVDPGVVTAGFVTLRECSHVRTGAIIINRIEVGADATVGAGAVVLENVPSRCTVAGVPARIIKQG